MTTYLKNKIKEIQIIHITGFIFLILSGVLNARHRRVGVFGLEDIYWVGFGLGLIGILLILAREEPRQRPKKGANFQTMGK